MSFDPLDDARGADGADGMDVDGAVDAPAIVPTGPWGTPSPVDLTVSGLDDPSMTADGLEMYVNDVGARVLSSQRATTSTPWPAASIVTTLPTNTYSPHVSADGLTLWAVITSPAHIVVTTRATRTSAWGPYQSIPEITDSAGDDGPSVTSDGLTMVFDSLRAGNTGIYITTRPTTGSAWSTPTRLTELDLGSYSARPHITDDLKSIYFMGPGSSAAEIWAAHRASPSDPFDPPAPVAEVNDVSFDEDPWVSADQHLMLFSSGRSGTAMIWQATR